MSERELRRRLAPIDCAPCGPSVWAMFKEIWDKPPPQPTAVRCGRCRGEMAWEGHEIVCQSCRKASGWRAP